MWFRSQTRPLDKRDLGGRFGLENKTMTKTRLTIALLTVTSAVVLLFQAFGDDSYNCHNYAWETRRRWLDDPQAHINDAIECAAGEASRVVYYDGDTPIHSGLYLGYGMVKSKWGANPIVVHPLYLSTYGFNVRFYQ